MSDVQFFSDIGRGESQSFWCLCSPSLQVYAICNVIFSRITQTYTGLLVLRIKRHNRAIIHTSHIVVIRKICSLYERFSIAKCERTYFHDKTNICNVRENGV